MGGGRGKELVYAGKIGTGFNGELPRDRGIHRVKPLLVADVDSAEWTTDGRLRHPSFVGLRRDKAPAEVVREVTPRRQAP